LPLDDLPDVLREYLDLWVTALEARGRSDNTIRSYVETIRQFAGYCRESKQPTEPAKLRAPHVDAYIHHVLQTRSSATAALRYRSLQQFFRYLVDADVLDRSPMEKSQPPRVEEKVVDVVATEDLRKLINACAGKGFRNRRDLAIVLFMIDTGARLGEVAGLDAADVDRTRRAVDVMGKGRKQRTLPLRAKVVEAFGLYELERRQHRLADDKAYFLGTQSRLSESGITQMLRTRCEQAGIDRIKPHQLRHTFAHLYLKAGGSESDLMLLAGWSSRQMVQRYGASAQGERARDSHAKYSPLEQL
jgi:site-specific recombinase XerD